MPKLPQELLSKEKYEELYDIVKKHNFEMFGKYNASAVDAVSILTFMSASVYKFENDCSVEDAAEAIAVNLLAKAVTLRKGESADSGFSE